MQKIVGYNRFAIAVEPFAKRVAISEFVSGQASLRRRSTDRFERRLR